MPTDAEERFEIQKEIWDYISKLQEGMWIVEHTEKRKAYTFLCDKIDELPELIDVATLKRFEPELKSTLNKKLNKIRNRMMDGDFDALRTKDILNTIYSVLRRKKR